MALELDRDLPPGALCVPGADALLAGLGPGALWWRGTDLVADAQGAVTGWPALGGDARAAPTEPNVGSGKIAQFRALTGLSCQTGVHSGLTVPGAVADAQRVTCAIRYIVAAGDPKTVLTLNSGGAAKKSPGENYVFVSEEGGTITVKDDAGTAALTLPAPDAAIPRLLVVTLDGATLSARLLPGPQATTKAAGAILTGPGNLFVGCRNQRPKLLKTLGDAVIADIWLMPGAAPPAFLATLHRYATWDLA